MGRILGLDLGTNSIGWALIEAEKQGDGFQPQGIIAADSRIIPMDGDSLDKYTKGASISKTADTRMARSNRRLNERVKLRRQRLNRVLSIMGFLPQHYQSALDRYGNFIPQAECKLAWKQDNTGKYEFLFHQSFQEMMEEFHRRHPMLQTDGHKIPADWLIYYLRKKALTSRIEKEELAWILLNFNQKRGYNPTRDEIEVEDTKKRMEYHILKVVEVVDTGETRKGKSIYNITFENGWEYSQTSKTPAQRGDSIELIATITLDEDGKIALDKEGKERISLRLPSSDDWTLQMKRTESQIEKSGKTVGVFIYDQLLENPSQKIKGKFVRTIGRKHYRNELLAILRKQCEFHEELTNRQLYQECIEALYPNNESHRNNIANKDFVYLLTDDILFYQRPLKSKKSLISNCPFETRKGLDTEKKSEQIYPVKCVSKSHPLYQEFRLWEFINNLRIIDEADGKNNDITQQYLTEREKVNLFDWLNDRKEIDSKSFWSYPPFKKIKTDTIRWNYVPDKKYPCNQTRGEFLALAKKANIHPSFFSEKPTEELWHILYSINNQKELVSALERFAARHHLPETFVSVFQTIKPFEKTYGAYSLKAIKKLLPLMRRGKYWDAEAIDGETRRWIDLFIEKKVIDKRINDRIGDKIRNFSTIADFSGLSQWLACYIVYNRYSEGREVAKWHTSEDIEHYLNEFKQHSLRNPIVEQVVTETLRVVKDIWVKYGKIDEIHLEIGRDLKNDKKERERMTADISRNEDTNLRIQYMLQQFINPEFGVEGVIATSHLHQDKLRIYEEGAMNHASIQKVENDMDMEDIITKIHKEKKLENVSNAEWARYKLWLEQHYRSPYTGKTIPFAKLFTKAYEIEHIIPKAVYYDDSLSNKVICEAEINSVKGKRLGLEFIKEQHDKIIETIGGNVKIFNEEEYRDFIRKNYGTTGPKVKKLLAEDIDAGFTARQLNDTRYISRFVMGLLSNIVRDEEEQEVVSKHLIVTNGRITDKLKQDWGIHDVWNKVVLPRFENLNRRLQTDKYTRRNNNHLIPVIPLEIKKGMNKKRIDHRHHAMDAIIIACANRNMINLLNNMSAKSPNGREDLKTLLMRNQQFIKPWRTFTQDVYKILDGMIVSFKQNLRVVNKGSNYYTKYDLNGRKKSFKQQSTDDLVVRKPMHKETFYGGINLHLKKHVSFIHAIGQPTRIVNKKLRKKVLKLQSEKYDTKAIKRYFEAETNEWKDITKSKVEVFYYTNETKDKYFSCRKQLDSSFDTKKISESIADGAIKKILLNYLSSCNNDSEVAFSPEGIMRLNENISRYNDGVPHKPIQKVRVFEKADKFAVGETGCKKSQFVEAAKNTNLYFAIYEEDGERNFASIPLRIVVERLKQGLSPAPANENGIEAKYVLSPNDLVYLPTADEIANNKISSPLDTNRIYRVVSFTGNQCFFVKANVACVIIDRQEFGSMNKEEKAETGEMIKKCCIPLRIDRLGNITLR